MSNKKDIVLSKSLSLILRHKAKQEGLPITPEGYIKVSDILKHRFFSGKYTLNDIQRVVATNDKKRFNLRVNEGSIEICANQGHSIQGLDELCLFPILEAPSHDVIHGTYIENWNIIKSKGLSRMNRTHIHFAKGLSSDRSVISGMRRNCQVFIYINVAAALTDGIQFFKSANEVILSPGDAQGLISSKYFLKVQDLYGHDLM